MKSEASRKKPENGVRPKIASYIRIHPGTSFNTIKTIFDLSDSTLRYHLRFLEKKGKIKSDPNQRIYYPTGHGGENTLTKTQQLLLYTIKNHPGITQKELAAKTKINRLTIRNNIKFLVKGEMLSIVKIGKEIHHFYIQPEDLEKTKMMRLITKFLLDKVDEETYWDLRREYLGKKEM
jgi:predicted transcriptional regulator